MGLVLEAEDPQLKRLVALKVMHSTLAADPGFRQRFLQEAQAAAALDHEHIVTIYQAGEEHGVLFLSMQLLRGETLDSRLRREGHLPQAEVLRIGREIAEGLAAAHERGLIHRDIKPANIWLEGERSRVKILDFGLALSVSDASSPLTGTGAILGTPGYMAPEQARRSQQVDLRCDLFSLGAVLYHLCTGREPYAGGDSMATLFALASGQPPAPDRVNPEVSSALSKLVMWLLAKEPAERPPCARDVAQRLVVMERGRDEAPPPLADTAAALSAEKKTDRVAALLEERRKKKEAERRSARRRMLHLLLFIVTFLLVGLLGAAINEFGFSVRRRGAETNQATPPSTSPR
jgi:serine/threonine protein kinase